MRKLSKLTLVLALLVFVLSVVRVCAQPETPPESVALPVTEIPGIYEFVAFLASPAGLVFLGALISVALARWPWYLLQSDANKRAVAIGGTALAGMLCKVLVLYVPAGFWTSIADYWVILVAAAFAVGGNQGWFQGVVKALRSPARQWQMIGEPGA